MKRLLALLMSTVLVLSFSGCGKKTLPGDEPTKGLASNFNEIADEYDLIDDMPDYDGDKLDLVVWYGYGQNEVYRSGVATQDKFRDEMERVSGVRLSADSFDNNGQSADQVVSQMAASEDYPMVCMGIESSAADKFIQKDLLFDLSEYIPKYMPHYWKLINDNPEIKKQWESTQPEQGVYFLKRFHRRAFKVLDPDYSDEEYSKLVQPTDSRSWIWVRDDILKELYPEANTQEDIKKIYKEKSHFDKEDMTDVTIKSADEFKDLLKKIKDLDIKEGEKTVYPTYIREGTDDYWDLLTMLGPSLGGAGTGSDVVNNFTYYDGNKDEMVVTAEQPWFKELCEYYNGLYRDDLFSKNSISDDKSAFDAKIKNGEYAVIYGNILPPTDEELQTAKKDYSYRKVMIDIPCKDYTEFVRRNDSLSVFDSYNMVFFKTSMTGTQLEQTLRFIDFFYTDAGMKFAAWGPKKAGLYEETENGLRYTDKKFEEAKLYSGDKEVLIDYGLYSFPRIDYFIYPEGINKFQPEFEYKDDVKPIESDWVKYWNYGYVEPLPEFPFPNFGWQIYNFGKYCEPAQKFWDSRTKVEKCFGKVLVADTDDEFESAYKALLDEIHNDGLDEEGMKALNETLKARCGDSYEELLNWTAGAATTAEATEEATADTAEENAESAETETEATDNAA